MDLGTCWTYPLRGDNRRWLMRRSAGPWRVRCPYRPDAEFDPAFSLVETGGLSLEVVVEVAYTYRQSIMLCLDHHYPVDTLNPRRYHRKPPARAADVMPQFEAALAWLAGQSVELHSVEVGNESSVFLHEDSRRWDWNDLLPFYQQYQELYARVAQAVGLRVPVIVGGDNPVTFRNRTTPGSPPSLAWWMAEQHGAPHVAWHPTSSWTSDQIRHATRDLRSLGAEVWITEDGYSQDLGSTLNRGLAAQDGGARGYNLWAANIFDQWQPRGDGIGLERSDGTRDPVRAVQVDRLSEALGLKDVTRRPRRDGDVDPPVEPPVEPEGPLEGLTPQEARLLKDRLGWRWDESRQIYGVRSAFVNSPAAQTAERKLMESAGLLRQEGRDE